MRCRRRLPSVAIGLRKLDVDLDTKWWVNATYGLIRLTIAILSAIVLYLLIKSDLILQPLFSDSFPQAPFAFYALSVAAGFSETLVPNILRRTEERTVAVPSEDELEAGPKKKDADQFIASDEETS
jgi:hypothetical protein